jgi:putative transposase
MLTEQELKQLYYRLDLPEPARSLVDRIRASPPARRVTSSYKSVAVRYPSKKMGCIIQAESHKNELAAIYEFEWDETVLEYYDQPCRIKLTYQAKNGKRVGVMHTPDFFVIHAEGMEWVECKSEAQLLALAEKMPQRYMQGTDGRWQCPPGEQFAQEFGLGYRVRSSRETNWIFQRNITFLEDYLRADDLLVTDEAMAEITRLVTAEPGISLRTLLERLRQAKSDDLYTLLATGQVYVDLQRYPLPDPEQVPVFPNQTVAQAHLIILDSLADHPAGGFQNIRHDIGELVTWNGQPWQIINIGETDTWLLFKGDSDQEKVVELSHATFQSLVQAGQVTGLAAWIEGQMSAEARSLLAQASPKAFAVANRRYEAIKPVLAGGSAANPSVHPRTVVRWVAQYKRAQQLHRCGYVGLLPQYHRSGNHQPKLSEATRTLMQQFIADNYETFKQKKKQAVYGQFTSACEKQGIQPVSYKTFAAAIKQRPQQEQTRKRQGRKVAYQSAPFFWELEYTTPRHGDRSFEIAHLDHAELDLQLLHSQTRKNLGKCFLTLLLDAFSRRILAIHLSFERPSYRSCMMVLRECVRRHQRLPQMLVVDRGAEFSSIYFETLLAYYETTKKERPPSKPRYGSVIERLFGTTNTQFIYNLLGNTQITKHVKQITKETDPKYLANWTLPRLYLRLREWAYEVYDLAEHATLGQSPREAFAAGLALTGQRPYRLIPYNQDFIINTFPTTHRGVAVANPNRGIKVNYIHYWCDEFRHPEVSQTLVPIRFDPTNMGLAYAYVQGRWVQCISEHYARLKGRSESIVRLATQELRAQNRRHTQQLPITAKHIAEFVEALEREEAYYEQLWRDADNQQVMAMAENRPATPGAPPTLPSPPEPPPATQLSNRPEIFEAYGDYPV